MKSKANLTLKSKESQLNFNFNSFPLLKTLKEKNFIPHIDIYLSEFILKDQLTDNLQLLICHLSQAVRAGHLCIKLKNDVITPDPEIVWETNMDSNLSKDNWISLKKQIIQGFKEFSQLKNNLDLIYQEADSLYFQKHWEFESISHVQLEKLLNQKPMLRLDEEFFFKKLNTLETILLPEQKQAILQLLSQSLLLLSGGPGTGKTYTAGLIIKTFWETLSAEQKKDCKIILAAPTGKAAANLQKSIEKATLNLTDFIPIQAKTLHSLLKINSHEPEVSLNADLLVIDESSMIDIKIMSTLLKSLKPQSRIIFLGDPFQLPSIEPGAFFSDMCTICKPPTHIHLNKCIRTELQTIVDFAEDIKTGDCQAALQRMAIHPDLLAFNDIKDVSSSNLHKQIWDFAEPFFKNLNHPDRLKHFCLLSTLRKGPLGADQINRFFFYQHEKNAQENEIQYYPIMITTNSIKQNLYNGDIGLLVKKSKGLAVQEGDLAIFEDRKIPALILPNFEYAFCLSVHKSQGSEFDHVLLLMPDGSERFGREMVYTAVTRARKTFNLWSTKELFSKTSKQQSKRLSRIG